LIYPKNKVSGFIISSLVIISILVLLVPLLQGCKPQDTAVSELSNNGPAQENDATAQESNKSNQKDKSAAETTEETAEGDDKAGQENNIEEKITDNINKFSGYELGNGILDSRPLAIMVQNNPKARPHSGLIYADMVFELVAEGGVTRFITVYSSNDADIIGPVRSGRIYFAEIARSLDPIYTFWGTYPQAYEAIKKMDLDAFDANSTAYINYTTAGWRDPSRNEALEHTAFIDTYGIKEDAEKYGYDLEGGQSPLAFKIDAPEDERGSISEITVNFSTESYLAGFVYDRQTNKYLKTLAGQPHSDFETKNQITLSNVVVLLTDINGPIDSSGHMDVRTTGTSDQGEAYYFMDGNVVEGTWARETIQDSFEFMDSEEKQVLFNRGSTWVCIIQSIERLSY
jgi:hypothetical protein